MQESGQEPKAETSLEKSATRNLGTLSIASVALIIAILSVLSQFFLYRIHRQNTNWLVAKQQQLESKIRTNLNSVDSVLNEQQKIINNLVTRNEVDEKRQSILLAQEAEFLLTIAEYNLLYENNIELAGKLVAEANRKIGVINDPNINRVREIIQNHLTTLSSTQRLDMGSLISQLSDLSDQVSTLSSLPVLTAPTKLKVREQTSLSWKEKLMTTFQNLYGIISIRRLPAPVTPLPLAEQQIYILEDIRLKLKQAQWAVLHKDPTMYQESLQQAKKQLQNFYGRNKVGLQIIQKIDQLRQINIKPVVPDLSDAIALLQSYIRDTQRAESPYATSQLPYSNQNQPVPQPNIAKPNNPLVNSNAPKVLPS